MVPLRVVFPRDHFAALGPSDQSLSIPPQGAKFVFKVLFHLLLLRILQQTAHVQIKDLVNQDRSIHFIVIDFDHLYPDFYPNVDTKEMTSFPCPPFYPHSNDDDSANDNDKYYVD